MSERERRGGKRSVQELESELTDSLRALESCRNECRRLMRDREREQRFRAFAEQAADAFFLHDTIDGRILYVNQRACETLGYSREELLSRLVTDIEVGLASSIDGGIERLREMWRSLDPDQSAALEGLHRRKDGSCFPVEVKVSLVQVDGRSAVLALARDITERKNIEEALLRTQFSVDNARDAVYWIGSGAELAYVNEAACEHLGYTREELLGMTVFDIDPVFPADGWAQHWEKMRELGSYTIESVHQARDGRCIPVEVSISFMRFAGVEYHCAYSRDITERKKAEHEREDLIRELEQKNAELKQKNAELERYTYTVSHDLKNPLLTIRLFAGKLSQDITRGSSRGLEEGLARIDAASQKMQRLLEDLLELSRIGRVIHPQERVDLGILVREAASLLGGMADLQGVHIDIQPQMPPVWGDRVRLLEALQNLLENAIKFIGEQAEPRVEIGAREEAGTVTCWVVDNGIGVDPHYQEKIFGLFERLNPETEGTGVGLSLVRRIVEMHGGRCWVESPGLGQGSKFCFSLPLAEGSPPDTA